MFVCMFVFSVVGPNKLTNSADKKCYFQEYTLIKKQQ